MPKQVNISKIFENIDYKYALTVFALKVCVPLMIKAIAYIVDAITIYVEGDYHNNASSDVVDNPLVSEHHLDNTVTDV